ncbi:MAG: GGDEF domain-containing protein [Actinomycetota bacterium]|nr:GGDEF domain-containing protein [Actinomycetota bacterium]
MAGSLPPALRAYVLTVPLAALVLGVLTLPDLPVRLADLATYTVLLGGGVASVEATRRLGEPAGVAARNFLSAWWLPIAVLLPPPYALLAPAPLMALTQWRVRPAPVHRRAFSAAAIGLSYAGAAMLFAALPPTLIGTGPAGARPLAWVLAVVGCGALAEAGNAALVAGAVKLSEPGVHWRELLWNSENLLAAALEVCTGALVAVVAGLSPALVLITLPPVLLLQRSLLHGQLTAAARTDAKTGLLNAATWEREAAGELERARRSRRSLAVLLLDIDRFKAVNDRYGHLYGDQVLRALADVLRGQLREGDLLGRFGGEEFAVLLPGADKQEALRSAERLRSRVAEMVVPLEGAAAPRVTVSIGVAVTPDVTVGRDGRGGHEATGPAATSVPELLAAADAGLYMAKAGGRDQVHLRGAVGP